MSTIEEADDERPFVNEECGDTMWDAVLADHEARLAQQESKLILAQSATDLAASLKKPVPKNINVPSH